LPKTLHKNMGVGKSSIAYILSEIAKEEE